MARNRLTYQNWIVDIGYDPGGTVALNNTPKGKFLESDSSSLHATEVQVLTTEEEELIQKVTSALSGLTEDEREFIIRYYYMGESYQKISKQSGRAAYRLVALHNRSIKKLKANLVEFVRLRFKLETISKKACPLCDSAQAEQINRLITTRDKRRTWKPVIKALRDDYGIEVSSPQLLIGHEKYHMKTDID